MITVTTAPRIILPLFSICEQQHTSTDESLRYPYLQHTNTKATIESVHKFSLLYQCYWALKKGMTYVSDEIVILVD